LNRIGYGFFQTPNRIADGEIIVILVIRSGHRHKYPVKTDSKQFEVANPLDIDSRPSHAPIHVSRRALLFPVTKDEFQFVDEVLARGML